MHVDIIIPTYMQEEFTVKCLRSIRTHTSSKYRIIWVDNGSSRESRKRVLRELKKHEYLSIWLSDNVGFVKATNEGLKRASSEFVALLNNDTEVTPSWMERLLKPFSIDDNIAVTGPLTDTRGSWQGWENVKKVLYTKMPDLTGKNGEEISVLLTRHFGESYRSMEMIAFFCAMFRRDVFDQIGLLDEDFGSGLGDDDDACEKIRKLGKKVVFVPSAFVYHHHRTTFKLLYSEKDIKKMQEKNLSLYRKKHNINITPTRLK